MLSLTFQRLSLLYKLIKIQHDVKSCLNIINSQKRRFCQKVKEKQLTLYGSFEDIKNKNKNTYLDMIKIFINMNHVHRRGHVEFIYSALKNMESFGVHKDLDVYKALIDVLPKGKYIPTNMFQIEFMHYPKQQQCIVDLLEKMEDNAVMPDYDVEQLLLNIFGQGGFPLRKFWRMMYWMPKFKNLSPWPLPNPLPNDTFELAQLAIKRISSIDIQTNITIYKTKDLQDSIEDTWIVSAQSPSQKQLLKNHNVKQAVYVEGAFKVWLKNNPINYFILKTKSKEYKRIINDTDDVSNIQVPFLNFKPPLKKYLKIMPTVHEQEDGIILALCATGTSSKDSLLSWVRHLENDDNPILSKVPIVFTLKSSGKEIATTNSNEDNRQQKTIPDK